MADIFESKQTMPPPMSKDTVTAALAAPETKDQIFPVNATNNSVVHARSSGKKT